MDFNRENFSSQPKTLMNLLKTLSLAFSCSVGNAHTMHYLQMPQTIHE